MKIHLPGANLFFLYWNLTSWETLRCFHAPNRVKIPWNVQFPKSPDCQIISDFGCTQTVGCVIEGLSRLYHSDKDQ